VKLLFRKLDPTVPLPERAHPGDAGVDLTSNVDVVVGPGERALVPTGLAVAIPEGHAGLVLPRSGLASRHGLTLANAPGLIDSGYRGELRVLLLNADPSEGFEVAPGDRIAQLVVTPVAGTDPVEVESLDETARGLAGFGSTGR